MAVDEAPYTVIVPGVAAGGAVEPASAADAADPNADDQDVPQPPPQQYGFRHQQHFGDVSSDSDMDQDDINGVN